jgi:type II secretory pathway pseudopilin PulG
MSRYSSRNRILPVILVVVIMIVAIVGLVALARAIFFSSGSSDTTQQVDVSRDALLATSEGHAVQVTVRGPIVADENFNSYRITITPSSRTLTTYRGYLDQQIDSVNLGNNVSAYTEFVNALDKANLALGEAFTDEKDDTKGICATGRLYDFEIINGTDVVKRLWTSTCKGSPGSLRASVEQVTNLFHQQIPDIKEPLSKIDL